MKRIILMLAAGICLSAFSDDEYRSFTDKEGREVKAKIVKADPRSGKVTIEREGSRAITVPADIFSGPDQAYIKEWIAAQNFLSNSKFRIQVKKLKGGDSSEKPSDAGSHTLEGYPACTYEMIFSNRTKESLSGISVAYCVFVNKKCCKGDGEDVLKKFKGQSEVFSVGEGGKYQYSSEPVHTFQYVVKGETRYMDEHNSWMTDTYRHKYFDEEIEGIMIRVFMKTPAGNTFMREICEPSSVAKDYVWEAPSR